LPDKTMSKETDEQTIIYLFEDGDRALTGADAAELKRIYAADYIQYDEAGNATNSQELIRKLTLGAIRFVSIISTGRCVRLVGEGVAVVHGSEEDRIELGAETLVVRYIYMDLVIKRGGQWQIVASQLVKCA
jgi:hypothetical protein